jgi:hydroxypyruvate isomerase
VYYTLAPNIDLAFAEAGPDAADRVRAVAAAGFDTVEMFGTSTKDVPTLARVLTDSGVAVASIAAEPFCDFTFPGTDLTRFFDGLERSVADAVALGSPRVVVTTGVGFPGADRAANLERVAAAMAQAVERTRGSGVTLLIEAVNTKVDHPGSIVDSTADAVSLARTIGDPRAVAITYDLYHSVVNGEDAATELARAGEYVGYVEIADAPGRGAPGTGDIDWPAFFAALDAFGYRGPIGLEVFETRPDSAASLALIRELASRS